MKSFRRTGPACVGLILVILCTSITVTAIGCRRVGRLGASTTTGRLIASTTTRRPSPSTTAAGPRAFAKIDRRYIKRPELLAEQLDVSDPDEAAAFALAYLLKYHQLRSAETDRGDAVALTPETFAPETFAPKTVAPSTLAPSTLAPKTLTPKIDFGKLVPLDVDLPDPAFRGTPKPQNEPNVELPLGKPRPPFLAPEGTVNLSRGKPVACSDPMPGSGEVDLITDGDKEASDFGYLGLRPGTEWVQIDLQQKATMYAAFIWHNHAEARVYRDVIVQLSDDPDFIDAQTVFNNDYDNSSGMGIGTNMGYIETSEGKLIDCRGVEGRYMRLYSKGNHIDNKNHYTEVEVYGRPAL